MRTGSIFALTALAMAIVASDSPVFAQAAADESSPAVDEASATAAVDEAADGGGTDSATAEEGEAEVLAVEIPPLPIGPTPPVPVFADRHYAATPEAARSHLDAINAAVEQLTASVRSSNGADSIRSAARAALRDIQAARRGLDYHGVRFTERGGELVGTLEPSAKLGVAESVAFGSVVAIAQSLELELRTCLDLYPNTCHQQLVGDLRQLGRFDPAADVVLPEGGSRIAATPTLGLPTLVTTYLPDPVAPEEPKLEQQEGVDEDEAAARATRARNEYQLAMKTYVAERDATVRARVPHAIVNHALATGLLVDPITVKEKRILDGNKEEWVFAAVPKRLRDADDPVDETRLEALWDLLAKLDQEEAEYRRSLARAPEAASTP